MRLYAIRHKPSGELLVASIRSNGDADFCNDTTVELERSYDRVYAGSPHFFSTLVEASIALEKEVDWFNSSTEHPMLDKKLRAECEVVAVDITVSTL